MHMNYLAVAAAALASFAFGAVWYSQALFAGKWMALTGRTADSARVASAPLIFLSAFLLALVSAAALAALLGPNRGFWGGAAAGASAGACLVAASYGITYLFEQRPFGLWLINGGFHTVQFAILGGIVGACG